MTFRNFLDLRKKEKPQVIILEKTIIQSRSWKFEVIKVLLVIMIVSVSVWGISNADEVIETISDIGRMENVKLENFTVRGTVSSVSESEFSIDNAKNPKDLSQTSYHFEVPYDVVIETPKYLPLLLSALAIGEKVIVQGVVGDGEITIKRIIYFGAYSELEVATTTEEILEFATTTASTTESGTTTDDVGTTTEESDPSLLENISDAIGDVVDGIGEVISDAVQNVVDAVNPDENSDTDSEKNIVPEESEENVAPVEESAPQDVGESVEESSSDSESTENGASSESDAGPGSET